MKTAWRLFFRNKQVNYINLLGLSLGLSMVFMLFCWSLNEWSFDQYHQDSNRIFRLTAENKEKEIIDRQPLPLRDKLIHNMDEIETATAIRGITGILPTIKSGDKLWKEKQVAYIDENWFKVFDYQFIAGGFESFNKQPRSVILTEDKAKLYFGSNINPIGKTIYIDSEPYAVQAVLKNNPSNSSFQFQIFLPIAARHLNTFWKERDQYDFIPSYSIFIKLKQGIVQNEGINQAIQNQGSDQWKASFKNYLTPLSQIHTEKGITTSDITNRGNKNLANAIFILAVLIMLLVAINYINLSTAKSFSAAKGIALRKVIGGSRIHIIKHLISEASIIATLCLVLASLLTFFLLPLFQDLLGITIHVGVYQVLMGIGLWILLLFISFTYPILLFSAIPALGNLKNIEKIKLGSTSKRSWLVGFQLASAMLLITCSIGIAQQMNYIKSSYEKYDYQQLVDILLPFYSGESSLQKKQLFLEKVSALPEVQIASLSSTIIDEYNEDNSLKWTGKSDTANYQLNILPVDEAFQALYELQIQEGRWFEDNRKTDQANFIINETAVNRMELKQPILGTKINYDGREGQIIAVVKDFPFQKMQHKIQPLVLINDPNYSNTIIIRTNQSGLQETMEKLNPIYEELYPEEPFQYQFIKEQVEAVYRSDNNVMKLAWAGTIAAILISALGLYGISLFNLEQRNKEISIRKVLGSSAWGIFQLLSKNYLIILTFSLLVSIPIAWILLNQWLQNFAFKIQMIYGVFILAAILLMVICMLSIGFQTWRAAKANPIKTLRNDD